MIRLLATFVLTIVSVAVAVPGVAAQEGTPYPIDAGITALVVTASHAPLRVPGSDGLDHIEYDLLVTNAFRTPVTLTRVDALDPAGELLVRLEGDALVAATQPPLGSTPTTAIPASSVVAVVMDVAVAPGRVLGSVTHRISYESDPADPLALVIDDFELDGPELAIDPRAPITISPPLRGAGWLNANGCCAVQTPHRSTRLPVNGESFVKSETFAIDWVRLRDGALFDGDGTRNEDWYCYGAELLAVADGRVIYVRDDMPDEAPMQPPVAVKNSRDFGGNQVIIEIEPGVYAFYGHIKPGSVAVAVGDHVAAGQVIGLLGNSGNSTGPHLHFGLLDGPNPLAATSLPMVIDGYILEGMIVEPVDAPDADVPLLVLEGPAQPQCGTLPLYLSVADFGDPDD